MRHPDEDYVSRRMVLDGRIEVEISLWQLGDSGRWWEMRIGNREIQAAPNVTSSSDQASGPSDVAPHPVTR
jgi:hypothetical protein